MILIDTLIQGTLSAVSGTGRNFSTVPWAIYLNGKWRSSILAAENTFAEDKLTLSHISNDDGSSYVITNEDYTFGLTTPVNRLDPYKPNIATNNVIAFQQGIFVNYKNGEDDWVSLSLSSIPGGIIGGGSIVSIKSDSSNNQFIILKSGGAIGYDIHTTSNFVTFNNPNTESVTFNDEIEDVASVIRIGANYIAYGLLQSDNAIVRASISTNLVNWTLQGSNLPTIAGGGQVSHYRNMAYFSGSYFIHFYDNNGGIVFRTLNVYSSTDGLIWTPVTIPAQTGIGQQGLFWLVTSTAIELISGTHVYRSTNGTTWTAELIKNNIAPLGTTTNLIAGAKGDTQSTEASSSHIAVRTADTLQGGGKIVHLTGVNATPTLGYPGTAPNGAIVGWLQNSNDLQTRDNGFTAFSDSGSSVTNIETLYARNTGTRYYEITINRIGGGTNEVGLRAVGQQYVEGSTNSINDLVWFRLQNNNISTPNSNDQSITFTYTAGQVLGFLVDFTAQTCAITVDGTALATVSNLDTRLAFTVDASISDADFFLNVGQQAFLHNTTLADPWMNP